MGLRKRGRIYWTTFTVNRKRFQASTGVSDKRAAEERASELKRHEERRFAGLFTAEHEHGAKALSEHLDAFASTLEANGAGKAHRKDRRRCLDAFVTATGAKSLGDLDAGRAAAWLAAERTRGLAARSVNRRCQALKQFSRWCVATARLTRDPFSTLRLANEQADRRHERRALTDDELGRLVAVAADRPYAEAQAARVLRGVTEEEAARLRALGALRALLYAFAAGTGLRRGELSRLRWRDLDLEGGRVSIPAASAKARRNQSLDLRADLAAALKDRKPDDAGALVFPRATYPSLRTFKRDLLAAGIARIVELDETPEGATVRKVRREFRTDDDSGRVVDFHCLRLTFVTGLFRAGVHPRVAQALARHSKIDLTMGVYTSLSAMDTRGAVESLPSVVPGAASAALPLAVGGEGLSRGLLQSAALSSPVGPRVASTEARSATPRKAPNGGKGGHPRARRLAGVTGLEPATSGLTGRSGQTEVRRDKVDGYGGCTPPGRSPRTPR